MAPYHAWPVAGHARRPRAHRGSARVLDIARLRVWRLGGWLGLAILIWLAAGAIWVAAESPPDPVPPEQETPAESAPPEEPSDEPPPDDGSSDNLSPEPLEGPPPDALLDENDGEALPESEHQEPASQTASDPVPGPIFFSEIMAHPRMVTNLAGEWV